MEKTEEATAETESECDRGLGLERERSVIELELFESFSEVAVLGAVGGIDTRENHRVDLSVAGEGLIAGLIVVGDGIADLSIADRLDRSRDIADFSRFERAVVHEGGSVHEAGLNDVENGSGSHKADIIADLDSALLDADVDDNALVGVVVAVEDKGFQGLFGVTLWSGDIGDYLLEYFLDIHAHFSGNARSVHSGDTDDIFNLIADSFGVSRGEVYLIDNGDNLEVVLYREIGVREGLSLDALRSVHNEYSTLAGGERA